MAVIWRLELRAVVNSYCGIQFAPLSTGGRIWRFVARVLLATSPDYIIAIIQDPVNFVAKHSNIFVANTETPPNTPYQRRPRNVLGDPPRIQPQGSWTELSGFAQLRDG